MRRTIRAGVIATGLALALAACGGGGDTETEPEGSGGEDAPAETASELVVWADNSANTAKAIEPLCTAWAEENGVSCTVRKFNDQGQLEEALTRANDSGGELPDVFEGPHDRVGPLVDSGILAPIDLQANQASFSEEAVAGVTYNGNTYGVPWGVENVAMLTNKKLSPQCPGTLDEAVANAKKLIGQGTVTEGLGIALQIGETGDFYHWFPLFTADGGYAFARNDDGSYNPDDLGIGSEGAIAAGQRLAQLAKDGIIKTSVSYDVAREAFAKGKAPYFITGPWQIPEQSEALGADLQVCPVPNWEGSDAQSSPFLGIRAFYQTAKAPNATLASTFLSTEVQTTEFMDGMFATDPRPPAWTESYDKAAAADPYIKGFGDYGKTGLPMPNIKEMGFVFADSGLAEQKITNGQNPQQVLTQAAESIQKQIDAG